MARRSLKRIDNEVPSPNANVLQERRSQVASMHSGLETNCVHLGNFLKLVKSLPNTCVDLIIADPPYNASKGGAWAWDSSKKLPGFGGNWEKVAEVWDDMPLEEYFTFTLAWLAECKRVLRPTGSMWVHGTYHNAGIINVAMQMLGIEIINEVVWYKRNSFPNLSGRRLTASHETILWSHNGKPRRYRFNYAHSKEGNYEEDPLKAPGKQMRTVWDISNNKERDELKHGKHPTQKPERLIRRMIRLSSAPGDVCLVPFAGAGSECVAAKKEGLLFIGCEIDPQYVSIAGDRIAATTDTTATAKRVA
ncbi:MAG: site-specific DNA-methyltransferase [Acidocella sp.]|nr:site-specific DNA-methyltransferase [Acidocella sp.]